MSNDLLREEGFFSNSNIPDCEKLGLIALIGCGSIDQKMDSLGNEQHFASMCPKAGGGVQFVAFTYGRPESLSKMSVKTILHSIGFNGTMVDEMFSSMSDKEVVEKVVKFFRVARNTDKSKQSTTYETLIESKLSRYLEKLRTTDNYLTQNPTILDRVKGVCEDAYGSSKEEQKDSPDQPQEDSDDGKKKQ